MAVVHENVARTLEVLEAEGAAALVMELVPGGSLDDRRMLCVLMLHHVLARQRR
jgi:serine/threonine protein kinase